MTQITISRQSILLVTLADANRFIVTESDLPAHNLPWYRSRADGESFTEAQINADVLNAIHDHKNTVSRGTRHGMKSDADIEVVTVLRDVWMVESTASHKIPVLRHRAFYSGSPVKALTAFAHTLGYTLEEFRTLYTYPDLDALEAEHKAREEAERQAREAQEAREEAERQKAAEIKDQDRRTAHLDRLLDAHRAICVASSDAQLLEAAASGLVHICAMLIAHYSGHNVLTEPVLYSTINQVIIRVLDLGSMIKATRLQTHTAFHTTHTAMRAVEPKLDAFQWGDFFGSFDRQQQDQFRVKYDVMEAASKLTKLFEIRAAAARIRNNAGDLADFLNLERRQVEDLQALFTVPESMLRKDCALSDCIRDLYMRNDDGVLMYTAAWGLPISSKTCQKHLRAMHVPLATMELVAAHWVQYTVPEANNPNRFCSNYNGCTHFNKGDIGYRLDVDTATMTAKPFPCGGIELKIW